MDISKKQIISDLRVYEVASVSRDYGRACLKSLEDRGVVKTHSGHRQAVAYFLQQMRSVWPKTSEHDPGPAYAESGHPSLWSGC